MQWQKLMGKEIYIYGAEIARPFKKGGGERKAERCAEGTTRISQEPRVGLCA